MAELTPDFANEVLDAVTPALDGGRIEILTANGVVLARMDLGRPAFEPAAEGRARATRVSPETDAPATGDPRAYRLLRANGSIAQVGAVGLPGSDAELRLRVETIVKGAEVHVDSFVFRLR